MSSGVRYTEEFKRDAVAQVVDRGYSALEVATRLGISTKSLYEWKKRYHKPDRQFIFDEVPGQQLVDAAFRGIGDVLKDPCEVGRNVTDMDPIRLSPYAPAACESRIMRPGTRLHLTTCPKLSEEITCI